MTVESAEATESPPRGSVGEVFRAFLVLGLTSFGGPVAHIGYFRDALVLRRRWVSERDYADLVALAQFLPGPASSQVGMALGLIRGGYAGLVAAWLAFTLPSAFALMAFAYGVAAFGTADGAGWLAGLKAAAVAVVAHALIGMAGQLASGRERATIAIGGMVLALMVPTALGQVSVIALGALVGLIWLRPEVAAEGPDGGLRVPVSRRAALTALGLFAVLLVGLPLFATATGSGLVGLFSAFYRAGALVFGGGHVVLPLLQAEVVATGLVDREAFLAGYGAAQAVPGPLFSVAAFLGMVAEGWPSGALGGLIALVAIFLPSALLIIGGLPFWAALRQAPRAQRAMAGTNAAVVGLLAAVLYAPVSTEGITSPATMALAAVAFLALGPWRVPAWAVVIAAGALGALVA